MRHTKPSLQSVLAAVPRGRATAAGATGRPGLDRAELQRRLAERGLAGRAHAAAADRKRPDGAVVARLMAAARSRATGR